MENLDTKNQEYNVAAQTIKTAILQSQYKAIKLINREQLALYFGIGRYISHHSRVGHWGTGAITYISNKLQSELPGLRGFSERNLKNMRTFYEEWKVLDSNSAIATAELQLIDQETTETGIVLCKSADKAYVEYAVRDYDKPMGVATFKTVSDMPEKLRKALPDIEELKKLL